MILIWTDDILNKKMLPLKIQLYGMLLALFLYLSILQYPWITDLLAYSLIALSEMGCQDFQTPNPHSHHTEARLLALSQSRGCLCVLGYWLFFLNRKSCKTQNSASGAKDPARVVLATGGPWRNDKTVSKNRMEKDENVHRKDKK